MASAVLNCQQVANLLQPLRHGEPGVDFVPHAVVVIDTRGALTCAVAFHNRGHCGRCQAGAPLGLSGDKSCHGPVGRYFETDKVVPGPAVHLLHAGRILNQVKDVALDRTVEAEKKNGDLPALPAHKWICFRYQSGHHLAEETADRLGRKAIRVGRVRTTRDRLGVERDARGAVKDLACVRVGGFEVGP